MHCSWWPLPRLEMGSLPTCYIESFMYYLGVDIGGTAIKAGVVDDAGRILESGRIPTVVNDLDAFLSTLTGLIRGFQKNIRIGAVGIGVPGLRSSKTRTIETSPNIPCLTKVSLEAELADQLKLPVITQNDANAAAYGEFLIGAGQGTRHMVHLTVGTGLGSGFILDGKVFEGALGYAAEFGHTVVQPDGRPCTCGSRGCIETIVSTTGILLTAGEKMIDAPSTSEAVFEAARRGDRGALEVFEETGTFLGIACSNLINLFNPDMIAIGGGVMASGDLLLAPARREARRCAFGPSFDHCAIVQSKLWPEAGVIGAAMLARDRLN